jgi:hypothetical protein
MGALDNFFNELEARKKREGRSARDTGGGPNVLDQHHHERARVVQRSEQELRERLDIYEAGMDEQELADCQDFAR